MKHSKKNIFNIMPFSLLARTYWGRSGGLKLVTFVTSLLFAGLLLAPVLGVAQVSLTSPPPTTALTPPTEALTTSVWTQDVQLSTTGPSTAGGIGKYFGFDSKDRLHAVWHQMILGKFYVHYFSFIPGTSEIPPAISIFPEQEGQQPTLAIGPDDVIYVTFLGTVDGVHQVFYSHSIESNAGIMLWTDPQLISSPTDLEDVETVMIDVDLTNRIHTAWHSGSPDTTDPEARPARAFYRRGTLKPDGETQFDPIIQLNASNDKHAAWPHFSVAGTSGDLIPIALRESTTPPGTFGDWDANGVISTDGGKSFENVSFIKTPSLDWDPDVAVDPKGRIYVADMSYKKDPKGIYIDAVYSDDQGGNWLDLGTLSGPGVARFGYFTLDKKTGNMWISWKQETDNPDDSLDDSWARVVYRIMTNTGPDLPPTISPEQTAVDIGNFDPKFPTLAFDSKGMAYFMWTDGRFGGDQEAVFLKYQTMDGGASTCGNKIVEGEEMCDGDYSATYQVCINCTTLTCKNGYKDTLGQCTPSPTAVCGNGVLEPSDVNSINPKTTATHVAYGSLYGDFYGDPGQKDEECDDGNIVDGDGCSSDCTIEVDQTHCGDTSPLEASCEVDTTSNSVICIPYEDPSQTPIVVVGSDNPEDEIVLYKPLNDYSFAVAFRISGLFIFNGVELKSVPLPSDVLEKLLDFVPTKTNSEETIQYFKTTDGEYYIRDTTTGSPNIVSIQEPQNSGGNYSTLAFTVPEKQQPWKYQFCKKTEIVLPYDNTHKICPVGTIYDESLDECVCANPDLTFDTTQGFCACPDGLIMKKTRTSATVDVTCFEPDGDGDNDDCQDCCSCCVATTITVTNSNSNSNSNTTTTNNITYNYYDDISEGSKIDTSSTSTTDSSDSATALLGADESGVSVIEVGLDPPAYQATEDAPGGCSLTTNAVGYSSSILWIVGQILGLWVGIRISLQGFPQLNPKNQIVALKKGAFYDF